MDRFESLSIRGCCCCCYCTPGRIVSYWLFSLQPGQHSRTLMFQLQLYWGLLLIKDQYDRTLSGVPLLLLLHALLGFLVLFLLLFKVLRCVCLLACSGAGGAVRCRRQSFSR